ncbi:MAG TPA: PRC-barrel domain-containing protein [Hyphomicrobiaceae bacterium]|nr:PRC-barrel domain-containing protein [Hyphomicrobiaceae bacterium]
MQKMVLSLAAAAALAVAIPAFAQQKAAPKAEAKTALPAKTFIKAQDPKQYLARTRLIGQNVLNKEGQKVGDIEDLIVSPSNQIVGVIMGVGGFLGVGEKKIGVELSALRFETKDGKTTITLPGATKEALAAVEPYQRTDPQKSMLEKATATAKDLASKTSKAAKELAKKASDAVTGSGGDAKAKDEKK